MGGEAGVFKWVVHVTGMSSTKSGVLGTVGGTKSGVALQPRSRIRGGAWIELQNGRNLSKYSIESDIKIRKGILSLQNFVTYREAAQMLGLA